jgi:hypothetical protein
VPVDPQERDEARAEFERSVNMTGGELSRWLETEESRSVGWKEDGGESVGHEMGRRILELKGKRRDDLDEEDVERMQGHFVRLLESISASPDARLKSLEMLTDAEKEQQAAKDTRLEETSLRKLMSAKRKAVRPQPDAPSGD